VLVLAKQQHLGCWHLPSRTIWLVLAKQHHLGCWHLPSSTIWGAGACQAAPSGVLALAKQQHLGHWCAQHHLGRCCLPSSISFGASDGGAVVLGGDTTRAATNMGRHMDCGVDVGIPTVVPECPWKQYRHCFNDII